MDLNGSNEHYPKNDLKEWIPIHESGKEGGDKVSKRLKVLTTSLLVIIIVIVAFASTTFAAGPDSGDCPNPDCPDTDCPNLDCPRDGDGPKSQNGYKACQNGNGQYRYRFGQD